MSEEGAEQTYKVFGYYGKNILSYTKKNHITFCRKEHYFPRACILWKW